MNDLNLIKYIGLLLLVTTTGLILASCMDEGPPVLPGLEKSTLSVITYPEQATVLLNNKILNNNRAYLRRSPVFGESLIHGGLTGRMHSICRVALSLFKDLKGDKMRRNFS